MGFLSGKKLLITGVLSNRSIAYGIARACHREGAELAFSYVGERFKDRITELRRASSTARWCSTATSATTRRSPRCSTSSAQTLAASSTASCTRSASRRARRSPATFWTACRASPSASRTTSRPTAFRRWPRPRCRGCAAGSALLTLSYLGAERVVPNYNTMGLAKASLEASVRYLAASLGPKGVRVNGISAGPIKTLAAIGHQGLRQDPRRGRQHVAAAAQRQPSTMSATSPPSCCPTWRPASAPRSPMSTAASARSPPAWPTAEAG